MPFVATWMKKQILPQSEENQQKKIPYDITYLQMQKCHTNEPNYKTEKKAQTWFTDCGCQGGEVKDLEFGIIDANYYIQNL